jgi:hypothetical protein
MVAEAIAGLGAIKTAFDLAKGLKDIDDAARRNAAVIELQERILAAQQAQTTLVETIGDLKKQVAGFEAWEAKKKRYDLHQWELGSFSYRLKEGVNPTEPTHHLCATCFDQGLHAAKSGKSN